MRSNKVPWCEQPAGLGLDVSEEKEACSDSEHGRSYVVGPSFAPTQLSLVDTGERVELRAAGHICLAYFDEESCRLTLVGGDAFGDFGCLPGVAFTGIGLTRGRRLAVQTEDGHILHDSGRFF